MKNHSASGADEVSGTGMGAIESIGRGRGGEVEGGGM